MTAHTVVLRSLKQRPPWVRLAGVAALVLLACGALLVLAFRPASDTTRLPHFLQSSIGRHASALPQLHTRKVASRVTAAGFETTAGRDSVSLGLVAPGLPAWTAHARGALRATPFGHEAVTLSSAGAEDSLVVEHHLGPKTWRWRLSTNLNPRLNLDGSVIFTAGKHVAATQILPVRIFDVHGADVTPTGARWSLRRAGHTTWLELKLDDAKLPLPYVIDPTGVTAVSFAGSNLNASARSTWTVDFTTNTGGPMTAGDTITATFKAGFAFPAPIAVTAITGFGTCTLTPSAASNVLTITLGGTCTVANSSAVSFKVVATNTATTGVLAAASFSIKTSQDTKTVNATSSPGSIIAATSVSLVSFTGTPQTGSALSLWTVGFKSSTTGALGVGDTITAVFPATYTVPAAPAVALTGGFVTCGATAAAVAQTVTVTLTGASCALAASTAATFTLDLLTNPPAQSLINTSFSVKTSVDVTAVNPAGNVVIAAATGVGSVAFTGSPQTDSALSNWTVGFQTTGTGALNGNDKVTVTFPAGFAIPAAPAITLPSGFASCTAIGATVGQVVTVTLAGGSCSLPATTSATLAIAGITNPTAQSMLNTGFLVKTTRDTATRSPASNVVIAAATSPAPVTFSAASFAAAASTTWTVGLTSSATGALAAGYKLNVAFPAGFTLPGAPTIALTSGFVTCTATGATAGQVVTITLVGASCSLPANTAATLTIAGITNPAASTNAAAGFTVSTSTDTAAASPGSAIDIFGAASQLVVTTSPSSSNAGVTFGTQPVVKVQDSGGRTVLNDSATQVLLAVTGGGATVTCTTNPVTVTNGVATFAGCSMTAAGTWTLTASKVGGGLATGASSSFTISPTAATTLTVAGPANATAGVSFGTLTVTAKDTFGNVATGYLGTVHFTGGGTSPTLPANYTFLAGDSGTKSFTATLTQAGARTITATDTVTGTINGTTGTITVASAAAATLTVAGPANATAGVAFGTLTVTAKDAFGNVATGYLGTVHFTGGGTSPTLPANYTFVAGDNGAKTFASTTLTQSGARTITATDTVTGTINGTTGTITVASAAAATLTVAGPANATAGVAFATLTVTAKDAFGNVATGYLGTVHFTGGGTSPTLPANYTFVAGDNGAKTFASTTLTQSGNQTITATDAVTGTINGTTGTITVAAAAASTLTVTGPANATAGVSFATLAVTAKDAFGNVATGYLGTVHFTGGGTSPTLPANYTFLAGDNGTHTFPSTTLTQSGARTITAADTVTGTINGTTGAIAVAAASASTLTVTTAAGAPQTAGVAFNFTVTAKDTFGNIATGYVGGVHFTSSDPLVSTGSGLPADYTFVGGDNGTHTFSSGATLKTVGNQTITATDTVLSTITGASPTVTVAPAAAATLTLTGPANATAGVSFATLSVTAKDAFGNTATGYLGTVHFAGGGTSPTLPANYTFLAGDNGTKTFTATLTQSGARTITATDTVTGSINGTTGTITVAAAAASTFTVTGPANATAGVSFGTLTATAKDSFGNVAVGYVGTVHFSGGGTSPTLPANYTFVAGDNGTKSFTATLTQSGNRTITATDTVTGTINGTTGTITVAAAAVTTLTVAGPANATAGVSFGTLAVTAKDAFGNVATGYTGTVAFTGGGTSPTLPANYTFLAGDNGTKSFTATLTQSGNRTITATDTVTGSINGTTGTIAVAAAAASTLTVTGPANTTAGVSFATLGVAAKDPFGNIATGYVGTVHFSGGGTSPTLPANYTFLAGDNGTKSFTATLTQSGNQTITATDTVTGAINGTTANISVAAAAASTLTVTGPANATAGVSFGTLSVTAKDPFGNIATGYLGTVHFTGGGTGATLPGDYTFTGGDNGTKSFTATLTQSGNRTITATDTVSGTVNGTTGTIAVAAAAATTLTVAGPANATAGVSFATLSVTAKDAFGNVATGYLGTVHFSGGGTSPTLPANYTFLAGDNGSKTFTATLTQSGNQTITATDTVTGSINGTTANINVAAAAASSLTVTGPANATAGVAFATLSVTAKDAFGNVAIGYLGTVHFTGGGTGATLPGDYTFSGADNGTKSFTATLSQSGNRTITATDTVSGTTNGTTGTIAVAPAAASTLSVTAPANATAGVSFATLSVTAKDAFGNVAIGYLGTVHFTGGGTGATLPADYTFTGADNGTHTFTATLAQSGNRTITATDTVSGTTNGTTGTIALAAAAAAKLTVAGSTTQTAGNAQSVTVTALDAFGNVATGYTGNHQITFTGANPSPAPSTPPTVTNSTGGAISFTNATTLAFTAGVSTGGGSMTLYDAENAAIVASAGDGGAGGATAITTSGSDILNVVVSPATLSKFAFQLTSPQTNGVAFTGTNTLTAQDAFGNTKTTFNAFGDNVTISRNAPLTGVVSGLSGSNVLSGAGDFVSGVANLTGALTYTGNAAAATFTATAGSGSTGTSGSVTISPATATRLVVSGATTQTAGQTQALTVTAVDGSGNTATTYTGDHAVTFSGAASSPSPATAPTVTDKTSAAIAFGTPTTLTFTSGVATSGGSMALYKAENATIVATAGALTTSGADRLAVNVSAATISTLGLAAVTTSPTAGAADNLNLTALDPFGNTATSYTGDKSLTFGGAGSSAAPVTPPTVSDKTGSASAFGTSTTITFSSGVAAVAGGSNGVLTLYKAESTSITVTDGTHSNGAGLAVVVAAAAPSKLAVSSVNGGSSPTAGVAFPVDVQSQDAFGNLAAVSTGTGFTLSRGAGTGTLGGTATGTVTGGQSQVTVSGVTYSKAEAGVRITATHTSGDSLAAGTSAAFSVSVLADRLVVTSVNSGSDPTAGAGFAVTVQAEDGFGNPGNVATATAVALSVNTGTGTLGGTLTGSIGAGQSQVTISGVTYTKAEAGVRLNATRTSGDSLIAGVSAPFTVDPGAAAKFVVTGSGTQTAGNPNALLVTAEDTNGNTATSYTGDHALTFTGALAVGANTPSVTDKTGAAVAFGSATTISFTAGVSSAGGSMVLYKAESPNIVATDGGITTAGADRLSVLISPATTSQFAVSSSAGSPQTAGAAFDLTVRAKDTYGNTTPAYTGTVHFTSTDGQANLPANYTFAGADNGSHTFTGAVTLKTAGNRTVTATDTVLGTINGTSPAIIVAPAGVATLALAAATTTPVAGVSDALTVTALDPFGNTDTSYTGDKSLTFGGAASSSSPVTAPTVSDKAGAARAFGVSTTISFSSGVATVSGGSNGSLTLYKAQSTSLTVSDGSHSNGAGLTVTVSAAADAKLAILSVNGGSSPIAGAPFAVVVESQDAFGNAAAVTGATGVSLSRAAGTGTLGGTTSGSISGGQSQATISGVTYTKAEAGVQLAATTTSGDSLTSATSSAFSVSSLNDRLVVTSVNSGSNPTAGSGFTVTVQAQDAFGNPGNVSAATAIALSINTGNGTLGGTLTGAIAAGQNQVSISGVTYTKAEPGVRLAATRTSGDNLVAGVSAPFTVDPGAAAKLVVAGSTTQTAGTPNQLTITAEDANGNVATGYTGDHALTFSGAASIGASNPTATDKTAAAIAFGTPTTLTFANGVSTAGASLVLVKAESATIVATAGAITSSGADRLSVAVSAATTDHLTVSSGAGSPQTAGAAFDLTLTARDAFGNLTSGYTGTVGFSSNDPQAVLPSSYTFVAGDGGQKTFAGGATLKTAGSRTVSATDSGTPSIAGSVPVTVGAAGATKLQLTGSTTQAAGTAQSLTLTAIDPFGNTATGYSGDHAVTFSGASSSTTPVTAPTVTDKTATATAFGTPTTLTFSSGVSSAGASMVLYDAETATIAATAGALTTNGADRLNVAVAPASLNKFALQLSGPQTNGLAFTGANTLTAQDAFGNTVSSFNAFGDNVTLTANAPLTGTVSGLHGANVLDNPADFAAGVADLTSLGLTYTGNATTGGFTATAATAQTGTSSAIAVAAGAATKLVLTGSAAQTAGQAQQVTVTAEDPSGNTATTYTGDKSLTFAGASAAGANQPTATDKTGAPIVFGSPTTVAFAGGASTAGGSVTLFKAETAHLTATQGSLTTSGADKLDVTVAAAATNAANTAISASPGSIVADGSSTSAVTVQAKDAFGNNRGATSGVVTLAASHGSLGSVTNNGDGTYAATLTSTTLAQTASLTGTIGGTAIGNPTSVAFVPGPVSAAHTVISAAPGSLVADGTSISTITVQAKDANDNNLTGSGGAVVLSTDRGSLSAVTNNGNGTYTATLTSATTAGTANVTGTIAGNPIGHPTTVAFNPGSVSAARSTVVASSGTASTDTGNTVTVTVTVKDAHDNPIQSSHVVLDQGLGTSSSISPTPIVGADTDVNGQATFTVSDTVAEGVVYSATASGTLVTQTAGVTYQAGVPTKVVFGQQPASATSGAAIAPAPTVRILDAHNNLTASTANVSLAIKGGTGTAGATLSGTATQAAVAGVATFGNLSIDKAGTGYVLTATSGAFTRDSSAFSIAPGTAVAAHTTLTTAPGSVSDDGSSAATVTVHAKDVNDNSLTTGGATVVVASDLGSVSSVSDNNNGTYTAAITSTSVGAAHITATLNGGAVANGATVTFVPGTTPSAANTVISASPTSVTTDTATSTVTIQARDASNNGLAAGGATVLLSTDLGSLGAVLDNGDGTYTATLTSATVGVAHLTGTINGVAIGHPASVTYTPGVASAAHTVISAAPASLVANGTSTSTITVQAKDVHGNNLAAGGDTVVLVASTGVIGGFVDDGNGTYTATLTSPTTAGTAASITGTINGTAIGTPASVALTPGPVSAAHTGISAAPGALVADGTSTSTITVRAKDANDNNLTGSGGAVVLSTDHGSLSAVTNNGDGTYSATLTSSTTSGTASLTGTIAGNPIGHPTTVAFNPGPVSAAHTVISASPSSLVANGISTSTITVQAKDAHDNNVAGGGALVALVASLGVLSPVTDNGNGAYTATLTSPVLAGTAASITGTLNLVAIGHPASVALTPGLVSAPHSVISATPGSLVADGTSTSTITIQAKDANDNNLTGSGGAVVLSTDRGSLSAVSNNGDGTYTATLTSSTTSGTASLTGTIAGNPIGHPTTVAFNPGPVSAAHTVINATPTAGLVADGAASSTITVQAKDAHDNTLTGSGGLVVLATDRGSLSSVTNNGNGTYSATLTSTSAGLAHVTGTIGGTTIGHAAPAVTFDPGAVAPGVTHSTVVASTAIASTDGALVTVTVTVKDAHDNPIPGSLVTLAQGGGTSSSISNPLGILTDGNGQAAFTASDNAAEPVVYSATASSTLLTQTAGVSFQPGTATHLVYSQQPTNATAGATIAPPVTVRILDAHNNLTASTANVSLGIKPGTGGAGATLGGTATRTAIAGVATFDNLAIAKAGTGYELTASATSMTSADSSSFDIAVGAASAAHTTITASPASLNADGSSVPANATLTIHVKDAFDNAITTGGATVALATDLDGPLSSVSDNGDGTYTATLTPSNDPGIAHITGTLNGVAIGSPATVTLVPPVPVVSIDSGVPSSPANTGSATIAFHSTNDNSTTFQCSLVTTGNPDSFAPCSTPGPHFGAASYTGLADGPHTFKVRGVNGNGTGTAVVRSWTVDTTPPSVSFTTAPGAFSNNTSESLTASVKDVTTGAATVDFRFANTPLACPTGTLIFTDVSPSTPNVSTPYSTTWTMPADGSYVVCAIATDAAGNASTPATSAVVADRTKPTDTLSAFGTVVGPNTYVKGTPALHATATDATSGVDAVDFAFAPFAPLATGAIAHVTGSPYDTTWPTTGLADGTYTVSATATDKATNVGNPSTRTVIVDNTAPTASLDDPGAFGHGTIPLSVTDSDGTGSGVNAAGIVIQSSPHGASTWTPIASPATWTPADGNYDLRAIVPDNVGNSTTTAVRTILVDNTPPTLSDDADGNWHRTDVTVTLTATDGESGVLPAGVQYKVDSGAFTPGTSVLIPAPVNGSNDGVHTITWHATNRAGVQSPADKVSTVKIDATPPDTANLTAPAPGADLRGTITGAGLAATTHDATSGIASTVFRIAAAGTLGANPCNSFGTTVAAPFDTTALTDGHYDLWVAATDNAGNGLCSVVPHDVVIDNTPPVTTDNAPAGAQNHDVTVTLAPTDNLTGVASTEFSLDNGATWSPGTSVTILASSGDGTKTILYRSTDGAGNVEATKSTHVTIDTTAPAGNPNDPGNVLHGTVDLTASPTDPDVASVEFLYRLVGSLGAYTSIGVDTTAPYDVPWLTNAVADGNYDVEEIITDTVGNSNTVPLSAKTIDNTAPDSASVLTPAAGADLSGTILFNAIAHDATSGVGAVAFQVKAVGAPAFVTVDADTSGPSYDGSWNSIGSPDGPTQVRVAVTDVAGNGPFYSAPVTFTVDNTAPSVSLAAPANAAGSASLSATGSADIASVAFESSPHGASTWTPIGTDATAPFTAAWNTNPLTDGLYDVRATATDHGSNTGTDVQTVRVDNTAPAGSLATPAAASTVGGTAVALTTSGVGDPGGSGVANVVFQYRAGSSGPFTTAATATSAPFSGSWDVTPLPSGSYEVEAVVTDNAGNQSTSAVHSITVDSTPPTLSSFSVAPVISGSTVLSVSTSIDTASAIYEIKLSSGGSWTQVGSSSVGPTFNATFATNSVADGTYDIRATVADQFGNRVSSTASNIVVDNTPPDVVSTDPADGSMLGSVDHIDLIATEPVASVLSLSLDDHPTSIVPVISGTSVHFPTGTLAPGNHHLTGLLVDAAGNSRPFRVNLTVTNGATPGMSATSKNVAPGGTTTLAASSGLATVNLPVGLWTAGPPDPQDFLVLKIDPVPAALADPGALQFASTVLDVRLFWNLQQTDEHHFDAPIEIVMTDTTGTNASLPATFENGAWRLIPQLPSSSLPAGIQDGYWRDGATVHVLTRHLTMFTLLAPNTTLQIAAPQDVAGVVAADGLTVRWVPGIPGDQVNNFFLYVDGQKTQTFGGRQFETKLGPVTSADPRSFSLTESNLAQRESPESTVLRVVPPLAGLTLDQAKAALAARTFTAGKMTAVFAPNVPNGTIVGPTDVRVLPEGSAVDLQVGSPSVARSPFAFNVASAPRLRATGHTLVGRVLITDRARIDVTLDAKPYDRIQRWHFRHVGTGATILRMPLAQPLHPGSYRLYWKAIATTDGSVQRHVTPLVIVAPRASAHTASTAQIVVVQGARSTQAIAKTKKSHVEKASAEQTYSYATYHDVSAIVLNVDATGLPLLKSFRTIFPQTAVIAISKSPATLAKAAQLGAIAVPSNASTAKIAALIAHLLKR